MKFKIAAISIHDDAENEGFYELEAILNAAEEAKEIKIDMLVKVDIHVDVVTDEGDEGTSLIVTLKEKLLKVKPLMR